MPDKEGSRSPEGGDPGLTAGKQWSTERKVVVGFSFALACLAIVGVMSYRSVARLRENEAAVRHTQEVLSNLELCLSTTADAETAERGYVITGDEEYLEPYRRALQRIDGVEHHLYELTRDNRTQEERLHGLDVLVAQRLSTLSRIIEFRKTRGFEVAQQEILTGQGKRFHDQIRVLIDTMKETESGLLRERELQTQRSTIAAQAVILGGSLGAFAVAGLAMMAIRRELARRRRAERALQLTNEQLEARVKDRTADLARANVSLGESERRFRALIEHSSDCITLLDANNEVVFLSPAIMAVAGYTPEERLGQPGMQHIHPDDAPRLRPVLQQLRAQPGTPIPLQWRGRHKNGQWIWVEGVAINLLDDPAVRAIVVNYRNITERKQSEARLQAQLARLALLSDITRAIGERQDVSSIFQVVIRTLEEHLPVDFCCICRYEPGDGAITVSRVGAHSLELAMELAMPEQARVEIDENGLSRCVRGILVHEPDLREVAFPFPRRLVRGGLCSLVAAPLRVESRVFGILLAARRQANSFSSGECEFLRQVSEHVALAAHQAQLYSALQQAYDDLRQTQQAVMQQERLRALGKMASGIAHDINNAISPVTLYTEAMLEQEPGLSPRARSYLETILQAIEDVAQTVTRMREFYRERESAAALLPVDLNQLVLQVVDLTRAHWSDMAQQRGVVIEVCTKLTPDLPAALGVGGEIREGLTNLIFNAVDAMPRGGLLTIRTAPLGAHVQLEVIDTGVGMDEDTRRRCLEPFFTTKGERGTGLGLAMVYGTMQRHGGDLEIESTVGKGTTVRLSFAAAVETPEDAGSTAALPIIPSLPILIVDDDPVVLKSLRDTLEVDGHVVTVADGGQAGIDAFLDARARGNPFPVVITDLGMPHVDGRRVSSAVKAAAPETTVLLLTGWGQRLIADGEVPPHVDRVLGKPPKLREIRAALVASINQ